MGEIALNMDTYNRLTQGGTFQSSANTNSSSATGSFLYGAPNTGNSNKSIWEILIGNTQGILVGAGSLVTAIKADPNKIAQYQGGLNTNLGNWFNNGGNQNAQRNNNWVWIALGVLILAGFAYWAFKGGGGK